MRAKGGVRLEATYQTTINAVRQKVQDVMKQNWEKVGFKITLKSVDAAVFFTNTSPDGANHFWADIEMYTNSGDPDPTSYFNGGWSCGQIAAKANNWQSGNYSRYCNPDFDAILANLKKETDQTKRNTLATQANDLDVVVLSPCDDGLDGDVQSRHVAAAGKNTNAPLAGHKMLLVRVG